MNWRRKISTEQHDSHQLYGLPLGPVTQCQNELQHEEEDVTVFQEVINNGRCFVTKGPAFVLVRVTGSSNKIHNDRSSQPERGYSTRLLAIFQRDRLDAIHTEREPRHDKTHTVVDHLNMQKE